MRILGYQSICDFECFLENALIKLLDEHRRFSFLRSERISVALPRDIYAGAVEMFGGRAVAFVSEGQAGVVIVGFRASPELISDAEVSLYETDSHTLKVSFVSSVRYPLLIKETDEPRADIECLMRWSLPLRTSVFRPSCLLQSANLFRGRSLV